MNQLETKEFEEKARRLKESGKNYGEIARELGVSVGTVEYHLVRKHVEKKGSTNGTSADALTREQEIIVAERVGYIAGLFAHQLDDAARSLHLSRSVLTKRLGRLLLGDTGR